MTSKQQWPISSSQTSSDHLGPCGLSAPRLRQDGTLAARARVLVPRAELTRARALWGSCDNGQEGLSGASNPGVLQMA